MDDYDIKFFTELTKINKDTWWCKGGDLTGEESFKAEMTALDKIEADLDAVLGEEKSE